MIPPESRTAVFAIIIAAFAATLGIGMLIPAIPALTVGLPAVAHGALISAFAFARILVEVPAGFAIDRAGARQSSVIGLGIMIAGALLGLPDLGYGMLMVSVVVQGAGRGAKPRVSYAVEFWRRRDSYAGRSRFTTAAKAANQLSARGQKRASATQPPRQPLVEI